MAKMLDDETIEYVGILAKLELSAAEKEQAREDMGSMLDYFDKMNELDTSGVEPMSHVLPVQNVFREDVVAGTQESEETLRHAQECTLSNAPRQQDNMFVVPNTLAQ